MPRSTAKSTPAPPPQLLPDPRSARPKETTGAASGVVGHCNVVVLHGVVRADPATRTLPSGDVLISFDLRVPGPPLRSGEQARVSATPVCWIGPPAGAPEIGAADEVVVVGQVARRFFHGGSGLGSRVDVRALTIAKGSPARRRRAIVAAQALLS